MKSWIEYWNRPNGIFVSEVHKRAHYECILSNVLPFLPRRRGSAMLDWGCGEAFAAPWMAATCEQLYLYDPADRIRLRVQERYKDDPRIVVLDDAGLNRLPTSCLDLVLINSVVQYLGRAELIAALGKLRPLLKHEGRILIGDVIVPGTTLSNHLAVFLRFAYRKRFLAAALLGLLRNFRPSSYFSLQRNRGYSQYAEQDFLALLNQSGLVGERLPNNIAISPIRSSYLARTPPRPLSAVS